MNLEKAVALARLSLAFGRVNRVTMHEDGQTWESDTDHTVMLGLVACELAFELNARHYHSRTGAQHLDIGRVSQFALVHDLVEVYAGDTQTLTITAAGRESKEQREGLALERLRTEFKGTWLIRMLESYESQGSVEARFIKVVDKILPKLTHLLNECAAAKKLTDLEGFKESHDKQFEKLTHQYGDIPTEVFDLMSQAMQASEDAWKS